MAVRNAQLYQQVPLAGFWKPLLGKRRKFAGDSAARGRHAGPSALAVPLSCPRAVDASASRGRRGSCPARRAVVTAGVDGVVAAVAAPRGRPRGGRRGHRDSRRRELPGRARRRAAPLEIAESEMARAREAGDAGALSDAQSRRDEARRGSRSAQERLARTASRAPVAGNIVTPRLEERIGQHSPAAPSSASSPTPRRVMAEVAVPEEEASRSQTGQPAALKVNPYPDANLPRHGHARRRAHARRGRGAVPRSRRSRIENPDGAVKTGMLGTREDPRRSRASSRCSCAGPRGASGRGLAAPAVSAGPPRRGCSSAARPGEGAERPRRAHGRRRPARRSARTSSSAGGPHGRGHWVVKNPETDEVLHLRARTSGAHRALRRHADAGRDPARSTTAASRRARRAAARPRVRGDAARSIDLLDQSGAERNLALLAKLEDARQRAAEEKAEGFNPFFILFQVVDPERVPEQDRRSTSAGSGRRPSSRSGSSPSLWTVGVFVAALGADLTGTYELYAFLASRSSTSSSSS